MKQQDFCVLVGSCSLGDGFERLEVGCRAVIREVSR